MAPEAEPRRLIPEEVIELERQWRPEDHGLPPPTTRERGLARWAAARALQDTHPGQHVAYVDNWTGDKLDRVVVAAAVSRDALQEQLAALDPEIRRRVTTTYVRGPEEGIFGT